MGFFVHFVLKVSYILARQNYLHLGKPALHWLVGSSTKLLMSVLLTAFVRGRGQSWFLNFLFPVTTKSWPCLHHTLLPTWDIDVSNEKHVWCMIIQLNSDAKI